MRGFIFEKLTALHGENWYSNGVPGDVNDPNTPKGIIGKLLKEELSNNPYRREEYKNNPELQMQFTHLGNLKDIVITKQNWSAFEETFGSQRSVQKHFNNVITLRDGLQHFRDMDKVDWEYGRIALMWLRKCMRIWIEESQ